MKKVLSYILAPIVAFISVTSCVENDLPYPVVVPVIEKIEVDGALSVNIDQMNCVVNVELTEQADIRRVNVRSITFKDSLTTMSPSITGEQDLSSDKHFVLHTYADYHWKMVGEQKIERYFNVSGQVGEAVIDDVNRRVIAYVTKKTDLKKIKVLSVKLGAEGVSEYSEDLMQRTDFSDMVELYVTTHGIREAWHIFIERKDVQMEFKTLVPWTRVVWMAADGVAGEDNGFCYREAGTEWWSEVPQSLIVQEGGSFTCCLDGLDPETEYECYAYSGSLQSDVRIFTTEAELQLPNAGFEVYSNAESPNFKSWYDPSGTYASEKWWDSGNVGSTAVGASGVICSPDNETFTQGASSARLNSRYVVVKFAAGNLFSGEFAGLVGTSGGKVNFGRPFTLRPRKLTLMLKYDCGKIDNVGEYPAGDPVAKGDPDRCQVFVALGDWDYRKYGGSKECPVQVNTTQKETLFNPKSEAVIAYGSYVSSETVPEWTRIEIPLEYNAVDRTPTHIIVSCAASMLGDYFTGSSSSVLWLDDMILEY